VPEPPRVVIVADDLIWATRLAEAVTAVGAVPVRVRRLEDLYAALDGAGHAIVDLTARAYDGPRAVAESAARARVLAVGQHDDAALRKAALAAGAERVLAYRKLFEDGPATLRAWLRLNRGGPA
jgi:DNA-binding NarL/FixJ family response regulator